MANLDGEVLLRELRERRKHTDRNLSEHDDYFIVGSAVLYALDSIIEAVERAVETGPQADEEG